VLLAAVLAAGALAAAGCGKGQTTIVVVFKPDATAADADRVRAACDGLPNVRAQAPDTTARASGKRYPVHFTVAGGGASDKSRLYECLNRDPAVAGASEAES
jgi:hypothetical protein